MCIHLKVFQLRKPNLLILLSLLLFEVQTFCLLQKGSLSPFITAVSFFLYSLVPSFFFFQSFPILLMNLIRFVGRNPRVTSMGMTAPWCSRKYEKSAHSCRVHRRGAVGATAPALSLSNSSFSIFYIYIITLRKLNWFSQKAFMDGISDLCALSAIVASTLSPQCPIHHRPWVSFFPDRITVGYLFFRYYMCTPLT